MISPAPPRLRRQASPAAGRRAKEEPRPCRSWFFFLCPGRGRGKREKAGKTERRKRHAGGMIALLSPSVRRCAPTAAAPPAPPRFRRQASPAAGRRAKEEPRPCRSWFFFLCPGRGRGKREKAGKTERRKRHAGGMIALLSPSVRRCAPTAAAPPAPPRFRRRASPAGRRVSPEKVALGPSVSPSFFPFQGTPLTLRVEAGTVKIV